MSNYVIAQDCIAEIEVLRAKAKIRRDLSRLLRQDASPEAIARYVVALPTDWDL
jgi:hypothetical protein